jgi:hypothetical protein
MFRRIFIGALAALSVSVYSGEASAKHHHPRLFVYNTKGITLLANTNLGVDSALGVTDKKTYTTSFWLQGSVLRRNLYTTEQQTEMYSDPATHCEADGSAPGWCFAVDEDNGTFQFNFNNAAGTDGPHFLLAAPADANWHHYLLSFDTHNNLSAAYVDNVISTAFAHIPTDVVSNLNNSAGFHLGPEGAGLEYQAEWMIAGASVVCPGCSHQHDVRHERHLHGRSQHHSSRDTRRIHRQFRWSGGFGAALQDAVQQPVFPGSLHQG